MSAPTLPHNCNSWVIVRRITGDAIRETFNRTLADKVADNEGNLFEVIPTIEWLLRFNAKVSVAPPAPTPTVLQRSLIT